MNADVVCLNGSLLYDRQNVSCIVHFAMRCVFEAKLNIVNNVEVSVRARSSSLHGTSAKERGNFSTGTFESQCCQRSPLVSPVNITFISR